MGNAMICATTLKTGVALGRANQRVACAPPPPPPTGAGGVVVRYTIIARWVAQRGNNEDHMS